MIIAYNIIFSLILLTYITVALNAVFVADLLTVKVYRRRKWRHLAILIIRVYACLIALVSLKLLLLQQFDDAVNTKQALYLVLDVQNVALILFLVVTAVLQRKDK